MPSPTNDYPPLTNWQDFERLAVDLFSAIEGREFLRFGREGQRQDGIDAWALLPNGKAIVLQCKGKSQRLNLPLTVGDVDRAIAAVKTFEFEIDKIYLLTTAADDVKVQRHAAALSAQRLKTGQCEIQVWGWGSICDRINRHESVQRAHFGHWFKRTSVRQWIALASVISLLAVIGVLVTTQFIERQRAARLAEQQSVMHLQQFVALVDGLEEVQGKCDQLLSGAPFVYQADFRRVCTGPVASRLTAIEQQVEMIAPSLEGAAWSEVNQLSKLMQEDYRQAEMTAMWIQAFEDDVVNGMRDLCLKHRPDDMMNARTKSTRRSGRSAMVGQLEYYFVLRDFILPGLDAMKARVLVRARELTEQSVPADLVAQANRLGSLLQARQHYEFKAPDQPFTLSKVKTMSDRDIRTSVGSSNDVVEEARWLDVLTAAPLKVFRGRPKDVEALIACGVFQAKARALAVAP